MFQKGANSAIGSVEVEQSAPTIMIFTGLSSIWSMNPLTLGPDVHCRQTDDKVCTNWQAVEEVCNNIGMKLFL